VLQRVVLRLAVVHIARFSLGEPTRVFLTGGGYFAFWDATTSHISSIAGIADTTQNVRTSLVKVAIKPIAGSISQFTNIQGRVLVGFLVNY
jgi:hypothetical protein